MPRDVFWIAKSANMASFFDRLNQVHINLQGKGVIFLSNSNINALKTKIPFLESITAKMQIFSLCKPVYERLWMGIEK